MTLELNVKHLKRKDTKQLLGCQYIYILFLASSKHAIVTQAQEYLPVCNEGFIGAQRKDQIVSSGSVIAFKLCIYDIFPKRRDIA